MFVHQPFGHPVAPVVLASDEVAAIRRGTVGQVELVAVFGYFVGHIEGAGQDGGRILHEDGHGRVEEGEVCGQEIDIGQKTRFRNA